MVHRPLAVAAIVIGLFLAALDNMITSTAMPTVVKELGGIESYHWTFAVYFLLSTVTVPLFGRLSDLHGRKGYFILGVLVFMAGSAWAGAAPSMAHLIVGRAIQGLGAGALFPSAFALFAELFSAEKRGAAFGFISALWGFSSVVGPTAGGWLAERGLWRWCFWINLPSGVVAIGLLLASRAGRHPGRGDHKPDWPGAFLLLAASIALFAGLGMARDSWTSPAVLACFAGAALLAALLVLWERRSPDPFVRHALFRIPAFAGSAAAGFMASVAMFASIIFIPLLVQGVIGGSAGDAGFALTPLSLAWTLLAAVSGMMIRRIGARPLAVTGSLLMAAAFAILARLDLDAGWWSVAGPSTLMGVGLGLVMTATFITAQGSVPDRELGAATSLVQFSRGIGSMLGTAVLGSLLVAWLLKAGIASEESRRLLDPLARAEVPAERLRELRGALHAALARIFAAGSAVSLLTALITLAIPGRRPAPAPSASAAPAPGSPE